MFSRTDQSYSPSGGNNNPHSQMIKNHPWCFFGLSEIFCGTRAGIAGDGRAVSSGLYCVTQVFKRSGQGMESGKRRKTMDRVGEDDEGCDE